MTPAGHLIPVQEGEDEDCEEEFDENDVELYENFLTEIYVVSEPAFKVGRRMLEQGGGEDLLGDPPAISAASGDLIH